MQTFSSFAIDCVFCYTLLSVVVWLSPTCVLANTLLRGFRERRVYYKNKAGGLGGGRSPPNLQTFSCFAIDCVFFPLKRSFVSGEFSIKKAGGLGGRSPPHLQTFFILRH